MPNNPLADVFQTFSEHNFHNQELQFIKTQVYTTH